MLDLLDFLLGPLEGVSGVAANFGEPTGVEDAVALCFRAASGTLGSASLNFVAATRQDALSLVGTGGSLELSVFGDGPIHFHSAAGTRLLNPAAPRHVQQPLIQLVADELLGRAGAGSCPSTGTSALRTSRVMDQVLREYYGSRDNAFWTQPDSWPGWQGSPRG